MNGATDARIPLREKQHGGLMRPLCLFAGLLALLCVTIMGQAQEVESTSEPASAAPATADHPALPDIILFESATGDVHFPHKRHQRMRCKRCHHQIHARELETPHDEYLEVSWIQCQMCHAEDSEFGDTYFKCSGCHHAEPESIVDETISSKVVIHKSCWKCHKTGTGVEASKECSYCHKEEE